MCVVRETMVVTVEEGDRREGDIAAQCTLLQSQFYYQTQNTSSNSGTLPPFRVLLSAGQRSSHFK